MARSESRSRSNSPDNRDRSPSRERQDQQRDSGRVGTQGKATKNRQYRTKADRENENAKASQSIRSQQLAALEDEVLRNVDEAVRVKVEQVMNSEEVKQRIAVRLMQEREKLEAAVNAQVEDEKAALMEKKRREQEESKRKQEELERILEENRRKVEAAHARAAAL